MNICLIAQNASPAFSIFRKDFIKFLVSQGHVVYAFAIDYTDESREIVKSFGAIPFDYQLNKTGLNPFSDLINTLRLSKSLQIIDPDVVFSFFVKPSIYGTLAAKLVAVPRRICMIEGLGHIHTRTKKGFGFKKLFLQFIHGVLCSVSYFFADKILFLNPNDPIDLSRFAFLNQSNIHILGPIGLDLSAYPYQSINLERPIRFIFIARLLIEKGCFEFLAAARKVKDIYPNAEFLLLGGIDPDNPAALSQQELESVIAENIVTYAGHVSNVSDWIACSHVFVLPSYREGFPRSTQEAMAIGRPVITTDVPGCRETVVDGVNGFLVPPWDSDALAEKMLFLIEHPHEIIRMGDESHRIALEKFDVHKINPVLASFVSGSDH